MQVRVLPGSQPCRNVRRLVCDTGAAGWGETEKEEQNNEYHIFLVFFCDSLSLYPTPPPHPCHTQAIPHCDTAVTPAGLEPAIPGSVGRCLIHWATGPVEHRNLRQVCFYTRKPATKSLYFAQGSPKPRLRWSGLQATVQMYKALCTWVGCAC